MPNKLSKLTVMLKPAVHPDTVQMLSSPAPASPSSPSMSYSGLPRHHSSGRKKMLASLSSFSSMTQGNNKKQIS